jgi:hypothetical protein
MDRLQIPDFADATFWLTIHYSWDELTRNIRGFNEEFGNVFWGLEPKSERTVWVNKLASHPYGSNVFVLRLIFSYVCRSVAELDDLSDDVFLLLLNSGGANLDVTDMSSVLLNKLEKYIENNKKHEKFLERVAVNEAVSLEIRERIISFSYEKLRMLANRLADILWNDDLEPEVRSAVAELRRKVGKPT